MKEELPRAVREELGKRIDQALNPVEETLRGELVDIVRDLQLELFETYTNRDRGPVAVKRSRPTEAIERGQEDGEVRCGAILGGSREMEDSPNANSGTALDLEQLEAFRPELYFEEQTLGFDGLVFGWCLPDSMPDSGYRSCGGGGETSGE